MLYVYTVKLFCLSCGIEVARIGQDVMAKIGHLIDGYRVRYEPLASER